MFQLNNPPRWIARALQIVNGRLPDGISDTIFPVTDVTQSGFGDATYAQNQFDGSLGSFTTNIISCSEFESKRVKVACFNPDVGAREYVVTLRAPSGSGCNESTLSVGAGLTAGHGLFGSGRQWFIVPPACSLSLLQGIYTTTAGFYRVIVCTHAAGVALDT